eukprot:5345887-Prymnesium_polylepis.2
MHSGAAERTASEKATSLLPAGRCRQQRFHRTSRIIGLTAAAIAQRLDSSRPCSRISRASSVGS